MFRREDLRLDDWEVAVMYLMGMSLDGYHFTLYTGLLYDDIFVLNSCQVPIVS